jgi:hypothetical protein
MGLLSSNGELKAQDGYAVYAGVIFNMPWEARLGIEYNWGSQYWFNFTGAEDSLVSEQTGRARSGMGSVLASAVFGDTFFVTLGRTIL